MIKENKAKTEKFNPWRMDFLGGFGFIVLGGTLAYHHFCRWIDGSGAPSLVIGIASTMVVLLGFGMFPSGFARIHGKKVEKRAFKTLKLPKSWELETNLETPFGDLDGLITDPTGNKTAVEVKSYMGLKKGWFGGIRKRSGAKVKDPTEQVKKAMAYFNAERGVVWCPMAKPNKTIDNKDGVYFVNGDASELRKCINATRWMFF